MLVKSYLAIPKQNEQSSLLEYFSQFNNCEVTTPTNQEDVLVVVIENEDQ